MNIEQRAHEAAMAHLQSIGNTSSHNAQASYSVVYQGIIDAARNAAIEDLGGHQKALELAVDMARLHEQGMFSVERMQLRTEIDGLKSTGRHSKETWWAENLSFAAVGAILGAFAMWLL